MNEIQSAKPRRLRSLLWLALVVADAIAAALALALAQSLGFGPGSFVQLVELAAVFIAFGAYVDLRYENAQVFDSLSDARRLAAACTGVLVALAIDFARAGRFEPAFLSTALVAAAFMLVLQSAVHTALLGVRDWLLRRRPHARRVLIVGHGVAAQSFAYAAREDRSLPIHVVGCVDDGISEKRIEGVRILGRVDQLPELILQHRIDSVVVAITGAPLALTNRIKEVCMEIPEGDRPSVTMVPDASELLTERTTTAVSNVRDIRLEDVLQRDPVVIDTAAVRPHLESQVVLVTGAGGSIGSEICRQIATFNPELLLLLGHGENSLFMISEELRNQYHFKNTRMVLADVGDASAIRNVFMTYRPSIVLHAAAHKHVPIIEDNVCEAVRNNIVGTKTVALAAAAAGVRKFVLLSTDKAVNPTSVMGATKRMAELICHSFAGGSATEFVSVRFGNVLGSRGSVIPIFKAQIQSGGPVTITHRDMVRYFMTIPEAVSLVLQAMTMGTDGEVFVLDMGGPIKIIDLAETLIRLSGLEPYTDVDIIELGMRPGERLFEQILTHGEGITQTSHDRLFIAKQERLDYAYLNDGIERLKAAVRRSDTLACVSVLREFVPEFHPGQHLFPAQQRLESATSLEVTGDKEQVQKSLAMTNVSS